jgi:threonine/homoserine/homoserine lactone efflux protein
VPSDLLAFLGVALLAITTPGPDTAVIVKNTIAGGRAAGLGSVGGLAVGLLTWSTATVVGLTAILVAFEPLYRAIRYAGAVYLFFLGAQALLAALRGRHGFDATIPAARIGPRGAFRQALLSDLGNPKLGAFMTSLLPQFAHGRGSTALQLATLCAVFDVLAVSWFVLYVYVVARAAPFFARSRVRRTLDALMGSVLVAFGVRVVATQR